MLPIIMYNEHQECWVIAWNTHDKYLEVELRPDKTINWFYRDRQNNETAGTEEPVPPFPDDLRALLLGIPDWKK